MFASLLFQFSGDSVKVFPMTCYACRRNRSGMLEPLPLYQNFKKAGLGQPGVYVCVCVSVCMHVCVCVCAIVYMMFVFRWHGSDGYSTRIEIKGSQTASITTQGSNVQ